jgi:hypothetical protein
MRCELTIWGSPAAWRLCWPMGDSVGRALVVNRLIRPALTSLELVTMLPLSLFWFRWGVKGCEELVD